MVCGHVGFLDLKDMQLLQSIIATAGEQSSPHQDRPRNTALTTGGVQKVHLKFLNVLWVSIIMVFLLHYVKLSRSCATLINPKTLSVTEKGGQKTRDMNAMINVIMEDICDRKFMSQHSFISGMKAKNDKSETPATKPALPADSVQAIIIYHVSNI